MRLNTNSWHTISMSGQSARCWYHICQNVHMEYILVTYVQWEKTYIRSNPTGLWNNHRLYGSMGINAVVCADRDFHKQMPDKFFPPYGYIFKRYLKKFSSQHLKWIKKINQSCPKTRTHLGFRITLMKDFDPLQMLTSVLKQKTVILSCNNISQYSCFDSIFDQINASLVSIRHC